MFVTKSELDQILTAHKLWLETDGKEGERADLAAADLANVDLRGANLTGANLANTNLANANLRNAGLANADLRSANLPISIRDCWSFRRAKFSADALPWLILHPEWAEFKDTVQIAG